MKLLKVNFQFFKIFEKIDIIFSQSNIAVFIGENGKGKTSLLEGIAILLNQWVLDSSAHDKVINNPYNINKKSSFAILSATCEVEDKITCTIKLAKDKDKDKDKVRVSKTVERNFFGSKPILAFYRSERFFMNNIKSKSLFGKGTQNALHAQNASFINFVTWFRLEEDKENEQIRSAENFKATTLKLDIIRAAIALFFEVMHDQTYTRLHIIRQGVQNQVGQLAIEKNGDLFPIENLSDGERMLLLLVADIARQMAINTDTDNSDRYKYKALSREALYGKGIVLIDEIELHLHPAWQRKVVPALQRTFPNIQFLITTHSPQILSELSREDIFILDGGQIFKPSTAPIGRDTNSILSEVMNTSIRPADIEKLIADYFGAINQDDFDKVAKIKQKLSERLDARDPVFSKADALIMRKKMLKK